MPNKKRPLTIRQKKFVKAYVQNEGNGKEAAKQVYNVSNDNSASQLASQNLSRPNVKSAVDEALKKHEITIDHAIKPIKEGLEATTRGDYPNHDIRLRASGMALRLLGADKGEDRTIVFNGDLVKNKYTKE